MPENSPVFRIDVFSAELAAADSADSSPTPTPGRIWFLETDGTLTPDQLHAIATRTLVDPVIETGRVEAITPQTLSQATPGTIEITFLPGVTDPPADNLLRVLHQAGYHGVLRVATGTRNVRRDVTAAERQRLAREFYANQVVQRFVVDRPISPPFTAPRTLGPDLVETIALREADADRLLAISRERRLALDSAEMVAIQQWYHHEQRDPTDVELEMLAQTWSEHCVHKTFRATIRYSGPPPGPNPHLPPTPQTIHSLLKTYIRNATETLDKPWVHSAFVDNAGLIAFDDQYDLAFKVETHNHPSALEPFGGANTGVGGVIRDILGVSARPIANTDILCFGPPDLPPDHLAAGVLHPRRIARGVIHGVEDYGNKMGIPTVNGAILYHRGYTANPLVFCGCLGILPRHSHPTQPRAGDWIVAIGGRTGRDGLRGATFSSMEMDTSTSEIAGSAVQIGHPIMEKQVQEVVLRARDAALYSAITDCGAGGFSSAVGEMAEGLGADVQLADVTLKYPGLLPWEIWLSEAQERIVLAVPSENLAALEAICAGQDVEAVRLGRFTDSGRVILHYGGQVVGNLALSLLHDGIPTRHLVAEWHPPRGAEPSPTIPEPEPAATLLSLLAHPDIASKEPVVRTYDHEVQGGTTGKPFSGTRHHGPADGAVLIPRETQHNGRRAVALSNGICPWLGDHDPYLMAWAAVDEALRNIVACGADPDQVAILDNFCWGNPNLPDRLGALVRCAQGCHDAALAYGTPFISGKDSLNNEYADADGCRLAIPGTLLISAVGIVPDAAHSATSDLKRAGHALYQIGETHAGLAGAHVGLVTASADSTPTCFPILPDPLPRLRALHRALQAGLIAACHDCSEGGLAVTLAEMAIGGELGVEVDLAAVPTVGAASRTERLFGQSLGRWVVEVRDPAAFEALMAQAGVAIGRIGRVTAGPFLLRDGAETLVDLPVAWLEQKWRGTPGDAPGVVGGESADSGTPSTPLPDRYPVPTLHNTPPRVLILHANGTNRDHDVALACELAGGLPEIVHLNQLFAGERCLEQYGMLVIPGGFSYGDDLGAGVLWGAELRDRLGEPLRRFIAAGKPVIGICNGFQVLVKGGFLPTIDTTPLGTGRTVTLTHNVPQQFACRWVQLDPHPGATSLFTRGMDRPIFCPVAHGEGRIVAHDSAALFAQGLVPLTYSGDGWPANPNGSQDHIAALCNPQGNVLGLMPHPENHIFPWQHPHWRRGISGMDGLRLFTNALRG